MNGAELAALIGTRFPRLPIVFITGYAELGRLNAEETFIVQEPFTEEMLGQALKLAMTSHSRCMEEL